VQPKETKIYSYTQYTPIGNKTIKVNISCSKKRLFHRASEWKSLKCAACNRCFQLRGEGSGFGGILHAGA